MAEPPAVYPFSGGNCPREQFSGITFSRGQFSEEHFSGRDLFLGGIFPRSVFRYITWIKVNGLLDLFGLSNKSTLNSFLIFLI